MLFESPIIGAHCTTYTSTAAAARREQLACRVIIEQRGAKREIAIIDKREAQAAGTRLPPTHIEFPPGMTDGMLGLVS